MFRKLVFVLVLSGMVAALSGCATGEYATSDYERRVPSQSSGHSHSH